MSVVTMPKPKDGQKDNESPGTARDAEEKDADISTLKVSKTDAQLIGKIAAHRGKSVAKLFKDEDVNDFFTHLLLEEMRKESEKLRKKKP